MARVVIMEDEGVEILAEWKVSDNLIPDVSRYVEDAVRTLVIEQAKTELLANIDSQVAAIVNERVAIIKPLGVSE